ncbi:methyltransferase domain-containing protein [Candidatus Microgenomates bacterium]|nr:methyltransferase domain-containing protein [Candidatus Microgenomates bacterium]
MDTNSKLWKSDHYYKKAGESSSAFDYPGMKVLKKYSIGASRILDLGCGDGTRLNYLSRKNNKCYGVDISKKAISLSKKKYPKCDFTASNLEKLSFKDNSFDLVYSAFVLEHLKNPQKMLKEATRVLEPSGVLILMAPNFGSPNRISPPGKYSRVKKLLVGVFSDLSRPFIKVNSLKWRKVTPIEINDPKEYSIDCDTTIEPYIGDLVPFLKNKNFKIIKSSSLWSQDSKGGSILNLVVKSLGKIGLYPFTNWGPHLLVVAKKI